MYLVTLKHCLAYYLTDITTDDEKWDRGYGKITALLFFLGTSLPTPPLLLPTPLN